MKPPTLLLTWVCLHLSGCITNGPQPVTSSEQAAYAAFQRDRDACRGVGEQSISYVAPKDGKAVADRSIRVEAETQKCMLSRGWNDPRYDSWAKGRSWGQP